MASALGSLSEAFDVVKDEKFAGLGQLELDISTAQDIARAVQRLVEHAQSDTEDIRVAAAVAATIACVEPDWTKETACCRKAVPDAGGARQEGERWRCPKCRKVWVHVVDEAEGASWMPARKGRR